MYQPKAIALNSLKRLGAIAVLSVFALSSLLAFSLTVNAAEEPPAITNFTLNPEEFNPDLGSATISFDVNHEGKVGLEIDQGIKTVRVLALREPVSPGHLSYEFDGEDRYLNDLPDGEYYVKLIYYGATFTKYHTDKITIDRTITTHPDPDPDPTYDVITNDSASPSTFNPETASSNIRFTLTENVDSLDVFIQQNGVTVRKLVENDQYVADEYYVPWNGRDMYGDLVEEGTYNYKIFAEGFFGDETETGLVTVDYPEPDPEVDAPNISNAYLTEDSFIPQDGETTTLWYTLDSCADVDVKLYDADDGAFIETLQQTTQQCAGDHHLVWDGIAPGGSVLPAGDYVLKINATNDGGSDLELEFAEITEDSGSSNSNAPDVFGLDLTKDVINPDDNEVTTLSYSIDTCANITVKVFEEDGGFVRLLVDNVYKCADEYQTQWNGTYSNGTDVPDGFYYFKVYAANSDGSDTEREYLRVDSDTNNGGNGEEDEIPSITNIDVDPEVFDPFSDNTTLEFMLNTCADVTIEVRDEDNDVVDTLLNDVRLCDGPVHDYNWDGEDKYNDEVDEGDYEFYIKAVNSYGTDIERADVEVDYDADNNNGEEDAVPRITDVDVDPETFDPYDEETTLEFRLNTCADVTIEVRDEYNDTVVEILDDRRLCDGKHDYDWDGEDEDNDKVRQDDYEFYIRAENSYGSDVERADVEVDYDGHSYNEGERCAGYRDVSVNDPYCDALEYVTDNGIFDGYPDGMFRPYQAINRAETTKVILRGFNYPMLSADGTNLGFWDVEPQAWYMQYLRTALSYNIIQGYPDGSFQPARTVNRVELLKIFLESANVATPQCNYAPYPDTPIQADTEWYMPYVCYAKAHDLIDADYRGNFNPNKPMTRGDVATLFYRFAERGLVSSSAFYNGYDYYYNDDIVDSYDPNDPRLTEVRISDDKFEEGDTTTIYYHINNTAYLTVLVLDEDNEVVRELADDLRVTEGDRLFHFDGEDDDGDDLGLGDYEIRLIARNSYGTDREEIDFEIIEEDNDDYMNVYSLSTSDDRFDPDNESIDISFRTNRASDVTVRVYDDDNRLVREIWDDKYVQDGRYIVEWDGEDDDGDEVSRGTYTIKVLAETSVDDDEEEIDVLVI